jgi:hypothetical protein
MFMRVNSTFAQHREDGLIGFNSRRLHQVVHGPRFLFYTRDRGDRLKVIRVDNH